MNLQEIKENAELELRGYKACANSSYISHEIKLNIGTRIKAIRESLKMTQAQLAEKAGVSRRTIGMYESGDRLPPNDVIAHIVAAFGITSLLEEGEVEQIDTVQVKAALDQLTDMERDILTQFYIDREHRYSNCHRRLMAKYRLKQTRLYEIKNDALLKYAIIKMLNITQKCYGVLPPHLAMRTT